MRRSSALRPMAASDFSVSLPGLAAFSTWLSFTSDEPTVSMPVPVRRAMSSRPLRFSMLAPVASLRSLSWSTPSATWRTKAARAAPPPRTLRLPSPAAVPRPRNVAPMRPRLVAIKPARESILARARSTVAMLAATCGAPSAESLKRRFLSIG